jgi:chaperone LolA
MKMRFKHFMFAAAALTFSFGIRADAISDLQTVSANLSAHSASFTQTFTASGFHSSQKEQGAVVFGSLPRMRWEYVGPEQKLFVFDGTTSWFFIPSEKQVTVHSVSPEERASLPFVLLSDRPRLTETYTVSVRRSGIGKTILLKARRPDALIPVITLTVGRDQRLARLDYTDRSGNRTVFDFSAWKISDAAPESFMFDPPEGVQVVRN